MEKVVLKATKRDVTGKQVKALRRAGQLPGVIYGRHVEPISISLEAHSAGLAISKLTSSSLVTIDVDGTEYFALVREKQRNYIKGNFTHVDFLALDLNEKIRTKVRLHFTGSSGAVKDYSAVLIHRMEQLEVECLPTDLPERIHVDISSMKEIGNSVRVRDVAIPANVTVLADEDEIVIIATLAKAETSEEEGAIPGAEAAAAAVAPELSVERGKKEEEEAAADKKKK
jgi:large subunit ribosomal protein L25